jgi:hypothetical protein
MKKATLLCGILLALSATVASAAAGVNIRWVGCAGDGGAPNRAFACNTNTGTTNLLVASFELGEDILQTSGQELVVDLASQSNPLPAWWQMKNAGTCRSAALTMNTVISGAAVNCADWASGAAVGGIGAYNIGERGPNTARIKIAIAVPGDALVDLFGGGEYFSCNILVSNAKTVGTGNCAGCADPVCIVFNSIKITTQVPANDRTVSGAANGTDSNFATWQGGGVPVTPGGTGCPAATPTRNKTWSQVKSLYR